MPVAFPIPLRPFRNPKPFDLRNCLGTCFFTVLLRPVFHTMFRVPSSHHPSSVKAPHAQSPSYYPRSLTAPSSSVYVYGQPSPSHRNRSVLLLALRYVPTG